MTQPNARNAGLILIVDDEADVRDIMAAALSEDGHSVSAVATAEEAVDRLTAGNFDVAFVDINLPAMSGFDLLDEVRRRGVETAIVMITGRGTVANAIESTRRGAYDYLTKPFDIDALRLLARQAVERQRLLRDVGRARERIRSEYQPGAEIVGQSPAMQEIYKRIGRVAPSDATVLLQGESGSGKELIARALHAYSDRWQGPFVAVNCSAIPADLLESEMFGHERGAFTGATERHIGKFEQAAAGTLFLDEIADMPTRLQSKLLRVLQEREFSRVGGREMLVADCRIIAATNKHLEREVASGRFREDLFFRLNVVVLNVPPLRARREDIPLLVEFFLDRINRQHKFGVRGVTQDALAKLTEYDWPGNVRELENVLIRAAAAAPNRLLTAADIALGDAPAAVAAGARTGGSLEEAVAAGIQAYLRSLGDVTPRELYAKILRCVEKPLIEMVLARTQGNQIRAAEILGINRNTLRKKMTELGIAAPRDQH